MVDLLWDGTSVYKYLKKELHFELSADLQQITFPSGKYTDRILLAIGSVVERHPNMRAVTFEGSNFASADALRRMLTSFATARVGFFAVRGSKLERSSLVVILDYVLHSQHLNGLELSRCSLDNAALTQVAEAVGSCRTLRTLIVSENKPKHGGCGKVYEKMLSLPFVEELHMASKANAIAIDQHEDLYRLETAIKNTKLNVMHLGKFQAYVPYGNDLSTAQEWQKDTGRRIIQAIEDNRQLEECSVGVPALTAKQTKSRIEAACMRNRLAKEREAKNPQMPATPEQIESAARSVQPMMPQQVQPMMPQQVQPMMPQQVQPMMPQQVRPMMPQQPAMPQQVQPIMQPQQIKPVMPQFSNPAMVPPRQDSAPGFQPAHAPNTPSPPLSGSGGSFQAASPGGAPFLRKDSAQNSSSGSMQLGSSRGSFRGARPSSNDNTPPSSTNAAPSIPAAHDRLAEIAFGTTAGLRSDLEALVDTISKGGNGADMKALQQRRMEVMAALGTKLREAMEDIKAEYEAVHAALDLPVLLNDLNAAEKTLNDRKKDLRNLSRALEDAEEERSPDLEKIRAKVGAARRAWAKAMVSRDKAEWRVAKTVNQYFPEKRASLGITESLIPGLPPCTRDLRAYSDLRKIDSSGRHAVYSGRLTDDADRVVLKEYRDDGPGQPERKRVLQEVRSLQRLGEAPGIVRVSAVFSQKNFIYVEMPQYRYAGLMQWIEETSPDLAARKLVAQKLLSALDRVHAVGIVHCDIKPDNVFLTEDWEPLLGDFDVSQDKSGRAQTLVTQTMTGGSGGTLGFIAPEVTSRGEVSSRSDVFSMGVVLIMLFDPAWTVPPQGSTVRPPRSLPADIAALVSNMVATDPTKRPSAAAASQNACFGSLRASISGISTAPPNYWVMSSLSEATVSYEDVTADLGAHMQALIDRTVLPGSLGRGRDVKQSQAPYSRLIVNRVVRIESSILWRRYAAHLDCLEHKGGQIPPVHVATHDDQLASLALLRDSVNEKYLWHSTGWSLIPKIVREGFDMRLGSGIFGNAVYMAEQACKSDQYAREDGGPGPGLFPLLLCRVAIGHASVTLTPQPNARRPPCVEGHYDGGPMCDHPRADSILAECKRTHPQGLGAFERHREFVIFDLHQAYPEYLITYSRQ